MCHIFLEDTPPQKNNAKGRKGVQNELFLERQGKPNTFQLGMKDACCAEPFCCCLSGVGAPWGCTAFFMRKAVLETYHNGVKDFTCFQGYIPKICCCTTPDPCPGSELGVCFEACCCPIVSISIARIHIMDTKEIRPDPCGALTRLDPTTAGWQRRPPCSCCRASPYVTDPELTRSRPTLADWQLIRCSNCLQLLSCICQCAASFRALPHARAAHEPPEPPREPPYMQPPSRRAKRVAAGVALLTHSSPTLTCSLAAIFNPDLRDLAELVDLIADAVTYSVAGCMGAQIYREIKSDAKVKPAGAPPAALEMAGAPPAALEMDR